MFLENVGGTFPGPHLVVSSGSPTPSTLTLEQDPRAELPPAQIDKSALTPQPEVLPTALSFCPTFPEGRTRMNVPAPTHLAVLGTL